MIFKKNILAIIPARSGSKGIKDKNIKILNKKPMIAYTIEAAIHSNAFKDVIVSTDSQEYANISKDYGAQVPFIRPRYLSTDLTTTEDVIIHTIDQLKKMGNEYDYFMVLQPTSPLRDSKDISNSIKLLHDKKAKCIVSVTKVDTNPQYMNILERDLSIDNFISKNAKTRRQDLPQYYSLNGAIYLSEVEHYINNRTFYSKGCFAYIMSKINSLDIDDETDFFIAESILKNKNYYGE